MIAPHGGRLIERVLAGDKKKEALERAKSLPVIRLDEDAVSDVENIATGVYSPLAGFLGRKDFRGVLDDMRLADDVAWTVPIVLDVEEAEAAKLKEGRDIVLAAETGEPLALFHLEEKYTFDREEMAEKVYKTLDAAHPGVARTRQMKPVLLAGRVDLIQAPATAFAKWHLSPKETRVLFREKAGRPWSVSRRATRPISATSTCRRRP
jgi:sulfate adenylyltransferase